MRQENKNLEAIRLYLKDKKDENSLSYDQRRLLDIYKQVFVIYLSAKSKSRAVAPITKLLDVSTSMAYNYLSAVDDLFGNIAEGSLSMKRQIATDMALKTFEKANATRNLDQMNKANANYIKANALHLDEAELPDFKQFIPKEQPIVIEFEFLKKYSHLIDQRVLDKIKEVLKEAKVYQYLADAEEISFLEINDKDDE